MGFNFSSTGYLSEELSEEEVIFDRTTTRRNKGASNVATTTTSPRRSQSVSSSQLPDHPTQEQKIWTLTDTPRSTPLMAVPTLDDTPRTEVWTVNEISETKSLDSSFTTSSLSDLHVSTETPLTSVSSMSLAFETEVGDPDLAIKTRSSPPAFDLTDNAVYSPPPFTTQPRLGPSTSSEQIATVSSLPPHPSKPNLSLLPTASDESTPSVFIGSDGTSSSTESCKTPVAARNEVVIAMDDDDEAIDNPSEKSEREVLSAVKDTDKESSKEEVVIRGGLDDNEEALVIPESESDSSFGEMIYTNQEVERKNVATSDAIVDIMESDNDNDEMSAVNERSNQSKT